MSAIRDIEIIQQQRDQGLQPVEATPCIVIEVDGSTLVTTRPGFIWVSEFNQAQSRRQVLNLTGIQPVAGNMVEIGQPDQAGIRQVLRVWSGASDLTSDDSAVHALSIPPHRQAHQYPTEAGIGPDPVLVYQPALQALKCTGDGASLTVSVFSLPAYWHDTVHKVFSGNTLDLTSSVPTAASSVRYTLVYLNALTNSLSVVDGTVVPDSAAIPIPKPLVPDHGIPSAYVKLSTSQSAITTATHITDARGFLATGNNETFNDGLYLRLNAANSPLTGGLLIDGSEDEAQLTVQANDTQTSPVVVIEDDAGNDQVTFGGDGAAVFNEEGNDADFRVEGDTEPNLLVVDAGDDAIRMGDMDTNYAEVDSGGDVVFVGGAGLAFAEIYAKDSVATITVDSDLSDVLITQFTTNGQSNNCTADASNNKITFVEPGKYLVTVSCSASLSAGVTVKLHIVGYLNGVELDNIHAHRTISSTDVGSISLSGIIDVTTAGWDLDLRANIDSVTARSLTVEDINLSVVQVGGT